MDYLPDIGMEYFAPFALIAIQKGAIKICEYGFKKCINMTQKWLQNNQYISSPEHQKLMDKFFHFVSGYQSFMGMYKKMQTIEKLFEQRGIKVLCFDKYNEVIQQLSAFYNAVIKPSGTFETPETIADRIFRDPQKYTPQFEKHIMHLHWIVSEMKFEMMSKYMYFRILDMAKQNYINLSNEEITFLETGITSCKYAGA